MISRLKRHLKRTGIILDKVWFKNLKTRENHQPDGMVDTDFSLTEVKKTHVYENEHQDWL